MMRPAEEIDGGTMPAGAQALTAEVLVLALGVRVLTDGAEPPTYRFQQALRFAEGLQRRGVLDLAARCFRSTLWAGDHRCLDHVELGELVAVTCDPAAGRLVLDGAGVRLVVSRHGGLSVVTLADGLARVARRRAGDASERA